MFLCVPHYTSITFPQLNDGRKVLRFGSYQRRGFRILAMSSSVSEASNYITAAPIFLPDGPWKQIPGGVTAAKGFKAAGLYGGLRAKGEKPDLALVACDVDAISAGAFTTNVVAAAPVARAVLINAGQANAATGDAGYQDVIECANALAKLLQMRPEEVLIESTGVIGHRIKKDALLNSLPKLVSSLSSSTEGADSAAVAITTTDLVSKSVAIESEVGGTNIRVGGMAKGSGMIHPNMATMLGVVTTDALVASDVWRKMVQIAVNRSFNQITVDGDTSTNDTVIALASGLSGSTRISSLISHEAIQLQACLDAVMQGLAKSIAWDGEGATCLIEAVCELFELKGREEQFRGKGLEKMMVDDLEEGSSLVNAATIRIWRYRGHMAMPTGPLRIISLHLWYWAINHVELCFVANSKLDMQVSVNGAENEADAAKAAVYGRDPNWGRIACAAGYAGIPFQPNKLHISLGEILLMEGGQPLPFDRAAASNYLKKAGETHGTVGIHISIGDGAGRGRHGDVI
ncbi:Arginine biosynthesis bifunctional protein ArgJ, chloroplastic [Vitis vinifera]|uniref:Arginine biosynthesis bifunctional protein ArgJ, chloroplastic n=1 Tax=Vitis vinifera TaxID=29760 RepID=A0A438DW14_VITVI|nr:Arginine biosynthesis bifunctional protein ArgJ, chloroplastic [Vitis vinifera]